MRGEGRDARNRLGGATHGRAAATPGRDPCPAWPSPPPSLIMPVRRGPLVAKGRAVDVYIAVIGQLVLALGLVIWAVRQNRRDRSEGPDGEG